MYYLLEYEIRDGENEYTDFALIKTIEVDNVKVFKKFLVENYGLKNEKKLNEIIDGSYEVPNDYRIFRLQSLMELTPAELKAVKRLVTGYEFHL